jgi:hypothetical protein
MFYEGLDNTSALDLDIVVGGSLICIPNSGGTKNS